MKTLLSLLLIVFYTTGFSQDTILLSDCYQMAFENYPVFKQKELYTTSNKLKNKNTALIYYPKINLSGKASYQSDVTEVNMSMPSIPGIGQIPSPEVQEMSKDQYKVSVDVNQVFFDGGLKKVFNEINQANLDIDLQKVDVELYGLKNRINTIYFGVLILQETHKQIDVTISYLYEQKKIIESGVKNGILVDSDKDVISAEILKLEQKQLEIEINKNKLLKSLSSYIGKEVNSKAVIFLPNDEIGSSKTSRPEVVLFDLHKAKLDVSSKLLTKKRLPIVYGFGQLGYGRPGLNMLNNDFDSYYIAGAKLSWNIWDWNKTKREKQSLELQKQLIETQKETFDKNINIALENADSDINKLNQLIQKDKEIIVLREKITKKTASQLKNGIVNSTKYITELNAETIARISLAIHKIQLVEMKVDYRTIGG